ncbi:MAG: class I adenylate cyclase, partial [Desulfovibrionaceae bacterium]
AQEGNGHDPAAMLAAWRGGVDQQIALGKQINAFMMHTYVRIQEGLGKDVVLRASIDSHDVARLGGKLVAAFSRRKHKIERIPFVLPVGRAFTEFRFARERRGAHAIWTWGGQVRSGQEKRTQYVAIKYELDPAQLLAWVVANGLYAPGVPIDCAQSAGPVSARDLWKLLPAMVDFFPVKTTFDAPIDEMLEPERVLKAFFICNLLEPRERNEVTTVSIVYATNRGEMFCLALPVKHKEFRAGPQQFLDRHVPQNASVESHVDMAFFTPHMSRCPKMR